MAAKQSQEMRDALKRVAEGIPPRVAADASGVFWTSVYQALAKERNTAGRNLTNESAARAILRRAGVEGY
jgi:hypothetical protein